MSDEKRSKSCKNQNLILPPRVSGKLHGYCDLIIESITWTTFKTYSEVAINVQFWGSEGILCDGIKLETSHKQSKINPVLSLRYQINTNYRLFQSYLRNCEPVLLRIYSSKNRDLIATAEIPVKLHNLKESSSNFGYSAPIQSKRNFKLGKLTGVFNINFNISEIMSIDSLCISEKQTAEHTAKSNILKKHNRALQDNKMNKCKIEIVGSKKKISHRESKPFKPSTLIKTSKPNIINHNVNSKLTKKSTCTSSISEKENNKLNIEEHSECNSPINHSKKLLINYLTGQSMSISEERKTLKSINNVSPSQSILDTIEYINKKPAPSMNSYSTSEKINSVKVKVNSLEFNSYGFNEMRSFCKKLQKSDKYIIKCAVTSRMFSNKSSCNIVSPAFDAAAYGKYFSLHLSAPSLSSQA
jgi:hypothetical protein